MKTITIQPVTKDEKRVHPTSGKVITVPGRSPYPYNCDEDGKVKKQEFWKGNPSTCVGVCKAGAKEVSFYFDQIEENIDKINDGNYWAVYIARGEMCSFKEQIRITIKKKQEPENESKN